MIKPASSLPLEVTQPPSVFGGDVFRIQSGDKIICDLIEDGNNNPKQDAEYIKTACNEFPYLIWATKEYLKYLKDAAPLEHSEVVEKLLKRCGVEV